jgi:hypothetical protein
MCNCRLPAFASLKSSMMRPSGGVAAFSVGRVRWSRIGLSCTSHKASRPSGLDPSRDDGSLAGGTRLPVPPSFHSGVAITAPLRVP